MNLEAAEGTGSGFGRVRLGAMGRGDVAFCGFGVHQLLAPSVRSRSKICMVNGASERLRKLTFTAAGVVAAGVLSWQGIDGGSAWALTDEQKLIAEAWRVVDQGYLDRSFNNQDWFKIRMKTVKQKYANRAEAYQAIKKMIASLNDPYTRFLYPDQLESLTSTTTGDVAGIGVEMYPGIMKGGIQILNVAEESPALRTGLKSNDVIVEIDGEECQDLTPDEGAARIRGPPGSLVTLTIERNDVNGDGKEEKSTKVFSLKREQLKLKSVSYSLGTSPNSNAKVGYVKIKSFNASTADDAQEALDSLKKQGAKEYVVDLRNNPGGYFPAGVEVAKLFLDQGLTVAYVINSRGIQEEYISSAPALVHDPVVVLVNNATASASEVLAGALKDNDRATLVGEKTFGKGVVQTVSELSDGSGIAVTIAKYETPKHNEVNKVGIFPTVEGVCPSDETFIKCLPAGF